jgi:hypothetical protein
MARSASWLASGRYLPGWKELEDSIPTPWIAMRAANVRVIVRTVSDNKARCLPAQVIVPRGGAPAPFARRFANW